MTARPIPTRHWRSYGTEPLPGPAGKRWTHDDARTALAQLRRRAAAREALDEPLAAFPSWFLRITCDCCGQQGMFSETHSAQGCMLIRDIIDRMRHDGCGGREGKGRWSCSPASRAPAADQCDGSC
jgi:hypothetical protein